MSLDHLSPETLGALVDGELSPPERAAAQAHLNECHDCAKNVIGLHQLRATVKLAAQCNAPSPEMLARFHAATRPVQARRSRFAQMRAIARQIAAVLILAAAILGGWKWKRQSDSLAAEVLDQHLATLSQTSEPQVLSSDRHTVKPWFEGKLPFSFNLPEPDALPGGTILTGADLVYIDERPTALLLFTMHKHRASVFVSQASSLVGLHRQTQSGFHFVEAKSAGLEFLGVSDVDPKELAALIQSLTAVQ